MITTTTLFSQRTITTTIVRTWNDISIMKEKPREMKKKEKHETLQSEIERENPNRKERVKTPIERKTMNLPELFS